jgi:hypothetical protein
MMSRPSIIDAPDVGIRAREIRDAEMRVLAGCNCLPDPYSGVTNHGEVCPLWPGLPPATPPCPALAILADHRRAVADYYQKCEASRANGTFAK